MNTYYCILCGFPLRLLITERDAAFYLSYVCDDCLVDTTERDINPQLPPEQRVGGV